MHAAAASRHEIISSRQGRARPRHEEAARGCRRTLARAKREAAHRAVVLAGDLSYLHGLLPGCTISGAGGCGVAHPPPLVIVRA
jgi:hypothetical protein